nr:MAG TPA: hypothetical protein [Caudoviricetes sp.]
MTKGMYTSSSEEWGTPQTLFNIVVKADSEVPVNDDKRHVHQQQ